MNVQSVMGEDSVDELMAATCRALCRHGYADLTIQKIADEFEKGKSLIYYHYDDKEDLMVSFLEDMADKVEEHIDDGSDDPEQALEEFLELGLGLADDGIWELRKALLEVQSAAPYNREFAERFREIHAALQDRLEEILRQNDVEEPEEAAERLMYTIEGAVGMKLAEDDRDALHDVKEDLLAQVLG
jgi:AcrR family transcriptional regulator